MMLSCWLVNISFRAVFNLVSKVIRELLCFWFWFNYGFRLAE